MNLTLLGNSTSTSSHTIFPVIMRRNRALGAVLDPNSKPGGLGLRQSKLLAPTWNHHPHTAFHSALRSHEPQAGDPFPPITRLN